MTAFIPLRSIIIQKTFYVKPLARPQAVFSRLQVKQGAVTFTLFLQKGLFIYFNKFFLLYLFFAIALLFLAEFNPRRDRLCLCPHAGRAQTFFLVRKSAKYAQGDFQHPSYRFEKIPPAPLRICH